MTGKDTEPHQFEHSRLNQVLARIGLVYGSGLAEFGFRTAGTGIPLHRRSTLEAARRQAEETMQTVAEIQQRSVPRVITPEDAHRIRHQEVMGDDSEPTPFNELTDMAIQSSEIEADLLNNRLQDDEKFALEFVSECLAGSYNEEGQARWWDRPRVLLDGKTPREMWAEDRLKVVDLAMTLAGPMN